MLKHSHTPGPWKFEKNVAGIINRIIGDNSSPVCYGEILEQDARLISAAPDMLEVLEEVDECAAYWSEYDVPLGLHDRILSVIEKAKEEKP